MIAWIVSRDYESKERRAFGFTERTLPEDTGTIGAVSGTWYRGHASLTWRGSGAQFHQEPMA